MARFRYLLTGAKDSVVGNIPVKEVRRFFGWHIVGSPINQLNKKRNDALKKYAELSRLMDEILDLESEVYRLAHDLEQGHGTSTPWVDEKQLAWFVKAEQEEPNPGTHWERFRSWWRKQVSSTGRRGRTTRYSPRPDVAREALGSTVEFKDGHASGFPPDFDPNVVGYRDPAKGKGQQQGQGGNQQGQGKRNKGGGNQGGGGQSDPHGLPEF